jgi:hypothetical protein
MSDGKGRSGRVSDERLAATPAERDAGTSAPASPHRALLRTLRLNDGLRNNMPTLPPEMSPCCEPRSEGYAAGLKSRSTQASFRQFRFVQHGPPV